LRWHIGEQAAKDITVAIDPGRRRVFLPGPEEHVEPDVIWWRRGLSVNPPISAPEVDRALAAQEWLPFLVGVEQILGNAWHVNSLEARRRANAKAFQLAVADACGLRIPRTIFTNDAARARAFIALGESSNGTVAKLLAQSLVQDARGATYAGRTRRVYRQQVPNAEAMRRVPVILQERLEKAYELRVAIFGRSVFAVRIDANHLQDWRSEPDPRDLRLTPWSLPPLIAERCFHLMDRLGIVSGSFDFIVTRDGEPFFLEVNEQGQFLWLEGLCPELPLLDAFCAFLVSGERHFVWKAAGASVRLHDVERSETYRTAPANDRGSA